MSEAGDEIDADNQMNSRTMNLQRGRIFGLNRPISYGRVLRYIFFSYVRTSLLCFAWLFVFTEPLKAHKGFFFFFFEKCFSCAREGVS